MATRRKADPAQVDDLVVVVPGIMGSRLADADGTEVWGPSGAALLEGIRTFGGSVKRLALPRGVLDGHPGDGVRPSGVMRDVHGLPGLSPLVEGYTDLLKWLEEHFTLRRRPSGDDAPANLVPFAYDWRLSCRYNAALLGERVARELERWRAAGNPEAKVVFLCHSMGGLVARQYVELGGGAEVTRRVITLGTPYRGSLDALLYLVNGLRLNELRRGAGRLVRLDLTRFARSLPSLHQLTPDYACLEGVPGQPGLRYAREVPGLPGVDEELLADAGRFHEALRESGTGAAYGVEYVPVSGVLQPTPTTAELTGASEDRRRLAELLTIDGVDEGGDGRVPRLSSAHVGWGRPAYTPWEQHGSLQNNPAVRWAVWGWLAGEPPFHRAPRETGGTALGVAVPELLAEGEACEVSVTAPGQEELAVAVAVGEGEPGRTLRNLGGGRYTAVLKGLPAGAHRLRVWARHAPEQVVTALVLVVRAGAEA